MWTAATSTQAVEYLIDLRARRPPLCQPNHTNSSDFGGPNDHIGIQMVADFTRTDSLKMAPASGLHGDLEPCVRDGCASRTASKYRNTTTTATRHVAALHAAFRAQQPTWLRLREVRDEESTGQLPLPLP